MNKLLTFDQYKEEIVNYLIGHFNYKLLQAEGEVNDSSDFLKVCYNDDWSVYYVANMMNI